MAANVFPAFIRAEYTEDAGGFPAFQRAADRAFSSLDGKAAQFSRSFEQTAQVATRAIAGVGAAAGRMDLGLEKFRQAAAESRLAEDAYRALQRTTAALATETGDTSAAMRSYQQALGAHVVEAQRARVEAEAQVKTYTRLQQALDLTSDANSRLAASYRATFSEQARAAQQEVSAGQTQSAYNRVFAPGLASKATDNGATFDALSADLVRIKGEFDTIGISSASAMERMLAGGAAIDKAALSGTTLEQVMRRVADGARNAAGAASAFREQQAMAVEEARKLSAAIEAQKAAWLEEGAAIKSAMAAQQQINATSAPGLQARATDNGAGYSALAAEAEKVADQERKAAIAAREYEQALLELRQQVDPAYIAQQRFDREVLVAGEAMRRGDISAQQYGQRLSFLTAEMQQNSLSTRATRFASVQLGQQLQDMVIQAQMGTNAFVILAQQGSQTAFALANVGGTVGKVATFMAGWQGAIVFAALALGGQLIPALMGTDQSSKNADKSTIDFSNSIVAATGLVGNYTSALEKLQQVTQGLINTQALMIDNSKVFAQNAVSQLENDLAANGKQLSDARKNQGISDFLFNANGNTYEAARLEKRQNDLQHQLALARSSLASAQTALEARSATESANDKTRQIAEIERQRARLTERRQYTLQNPVPLADSAIQPISDTEYKGQMASLKRREDALNERKKKDRSASEAERAARAAQRLAERGDDAAKKIANISDRFSDLPPQVQTVASAMRELDDLANDFALKKPPNYGQIVKDLDRARAVVREALNKPFNDLIQSQSEELLILDQQRQGLTDQAAAMQQILALQKQMGPLNDQQKQAILDNVQAQRLLTREIDKQQAHQQIYLDALSGIQTTIRGTMADARTEGLGALKGMVSGFRKTFDDLQENVLNEQLFGGVFQDIQDRISGVDVVKDSQQKISDALDRAANTVDTTQEKARAAYEAAIKSLGAFTSALAKSAGVADPNIAALATTGSIAAPVAANDNAAAAAANARGVEIAVTGNRYTKDPLTFVQTVFTDLFKRFLGKDSKLAEGLGEKLGNALRDSGYGQMAGSIALGGSNSTLGSSIGGIVGGKFGEKVLGPAMTKALGKSLGEFAGPLGSIAGGIIGGALGGMFKKKKYGSAVIGATSDGSLGTINSVWNSRAAIANSTKSADATTSSIEDIAEQLGATIDAALGKVTIGQYDGNWRVSTTGYAGKLNFKGDTSSTGKGLYDFGEDADAAVQFATLDLIKDGVLKGLRAGSIKLLQNASDLQSGLSKALKFQGVFDDLMEYVDPVRASITKLNTEFSGLITIFKEAGATTEEVLQLEQLYNLKRQDASKEAIDQLTSSLQGLYDTLTIGDSGLSLTTRLTNAKAAYDPLAARVAAGDTTAYDDFAEAAQTLLDLQQQYSGSMPDYYALLDQVTSLTKGELNRQQSLIDTATGIAAPDFSSLVSATDSQTSALVAALQNQTTSSSTDNATIIALLKQLVSTNDNGSSSTYSSLAARYGF